MALSKINTGGIEDSAITADKIADTTITGGKIANTTIDVTSKITGAVPIANGGSASTSASAARTALGLAIGSNVQAFDSDIVVTDAQQTFSKAQIGSTQTGTGLTLDFDTYQNFIITLGNGSNTLAEPTTEGSQVGQSGWIIFIQPSSGTAGTISLHGDYETAGAAGLTLSTANNDYDALGYIVKADNSILLGNPLLNFG